MWVSVCALGHFNFLIVLVCMCIEMFLMIEWHVNPNITTMQINQWPLLDVQESSWELKCIKLFEGVLF